MATSTPCPSGPSLPRVMQCRIPSPLPYLLPGRPSSPIPLRTRTASGLEAEGVPGPQTESRPIKLRHGDAGSGCHTGLPRMGLSIEIDTMTFNPKNWFMDLGVLRLSYIRRHYLLYPFFVFMFSLFTIFRDVLILCHIKPLFKKINKGV